jgi:hypothetical protein
MVVMDIPKAMIAGVALPILSSSRSQPFRSVRVAPSLANSGSKEETDDVQ